MPVYYSGTDDIIVRAAGKAVIQITKIIPEATMARDTKWALKEAEEQGLISRITVEEDTKKKLLSNARAGSFKLLLGSIIFLAVAVIAAVLLVTLAHVIIYSVKMIILYIFAVALPFYAVYNIFATGRSIKNGDYDFYSGQIVTKTDSAYKVRGLEDLDLNYLAAFKPSEEPHQGNNTNIFRIGSDASLFS